MAPAKRRKTYLDPGSSASVPKATKWTLKNGNTSSASRQRVAVPSQASSSTSSNAQQHLRSADNGDQHGLLLSSVFSDDEEELDGKVDKYEVDECEDDAFDVDAFDFDDFDVDDFDVDEIEGAFDEGCFEPSAPHPEPAEPSPQPSSFFNTAEFGLPFADSAELTRGDAYMMLLDFALKYGLSWSAIEAVQKLFNNLLGKKVFPESKFLFKKLCGVDLADIKFHFYCMDCKTLLAVTTGSLQERKQLEVECDVCHKSYKGCYLVRTGSFFVSLPLEKQIISVLSSKAASSAVLSTLKRVAANADPSDMNDITDGKHYSNMRKQNNMARDDLTFTVNSDGSPVFKSAKYSIWPVQLTLNELPPILRSMNVMTPLLWYGNEHPNMMLLLQAFVTQLEVLNERGITWESADGTVHSKVFCVCCCADAPAKAAMQQMMQYNGYYGCSWCYHPGTKVDGVVKYCVSTPFADRTDEEAISDMRSLCQDDSLASVRGVKAVSPFINLPGFSAIWAWCPDYMHCVLLGVTRQITDVWLTEAGGFYEGTRTSLLALLNERLCSIRMPQCVNRQPRSLHARGNWKASEWQHWLLHYSVPCISGILEDEYVEHWGLLVAGVYLLLKDSITDSDVEQSSKLLAQFVVRLQFLYEENHMTYNVHQLLHLAKSAHLFGPLWAHSCFSFESNMGRLLKLVTSSNGVALQIATRLLLHSSFVSLRAVASEHALALIGIEETVNHDQEEMIPLGKPGAVGESSDFSVPRQQGDELLEYERLKVGRIIICSEKYSRHLRVDCTAVLLKDGTHAKVEKLLSYREPSGRRKFLILSSVYSTEAVMLCKHIQLARKRREKNFL
ncbi:uncharacterized protein LOC144159876 [Haemaphysalis longicornis]